MPAVALVLDIDPKVGGMTKSAVRVGIGTRVIYDGEAAEVVELQPTKSGIDLTLRIGADGRRAVRIALRELLDGGRARIIGDDPVSDGPSDVASVILAGLSEAEIQAVRTRAAHVREVLTGYRSGHAELAGHGEPRAQFDPHRPLMERYAAKAAELDITVRTIGQWVSDYRADGEAGLAPTRDKRSAGLGAKVDPRWTETAIEVMVEHNDQSRPSQTMVMKRTNARVVARFGDGAVELPSRATAFRVLSELEKRYPTFRLSTKRNRDIADRPDGAYGKLRPTRPGEYLLMDTTRLDVFAMDPVTLRWVQAELTVGMDWYTRCITGIRVTPVSTKSMDAALVLYQAYRPRPAGKDWPTHAVWPEHGIPRSVLVDVDAIEGPLIGAAGPVIVPETIVVDHGKIYVSDHLTSVCQRMGISIQPARLRTGRDKGPVERFFRTIREDLLQALPGYKGPDVHSRGLDPESEAFFYLDELEAIIREWVAAVYHHRPHDSLIDPHVPGLEMSPATMFEHGIARAGYIEAPRDSDLAYEFLKTEWRKIQHYGVDFGSRRYNGPALNPYRNMTSPYTGKAKGRWPIHYNPDDITRVYFRDPDTRTWHTLMWEHAPSMGMPLSEDALEFARKLAAAKYTYPDDRLAVTDLLERWNLGLGSTVTERRMALRLSREAVLLDEDEKQDEVATLPSVARVLATATPPEEDEVTEAPNPEAGDDDSEDDIDDYAVPDFYADALEDA
jgi:transposase InsO family protein